MNKRSLKQLLLEVRGENVSHIILSECIAVARSIAEACLKSHQTSVVRLCQSNGLTLTDLAYDCISEIFEQKEGRLISFVRFIDSLHEPLESIDDEHLVLAFRSFVKTVVLREVSRHYAQWDPLGAKIVRNIREQIKSGKQFTVIQDFRGTVLAPNHVAQNEYLPAFPIDRLEAQLSVARFKNTTELLQHVKKILIAQTTYRKQIPLLDLVITVKNITQREYLSVKEDAELQRNDMQEQIDRLLPIGLQAAEEKIIAYYRRQQITKQEANILAKTIALSLQKELKGDGEETLYKHLCIIHQVTPEEYQQCWQQKLEYCVRTAQEAIRESILTEL